MIEKTNKYYVEFTDGKMINFSNNGNISISVSTDFSSYWSAEYVILAVYLGLFSIVGILGNIPVLIVYFHRKEQSASNTFIKALAILDLIVCSMIMPYTMIYELHLVQTDVVCRTFEFTRHFAIFASNLTLVAIAAERYIAVCCITHKMSVKNVQHGMLFIFVLSCVSAGPSIGIFTVVSDYEVRDVKCKFHHDLTDGKFCHFTYSLYGQVYAVIYQGVLMVLFFVSLIIIVIFYIIIYMVLWQRTKFRKRALSRSPKECPEISEIRSSLCDKQKQEHVDNEVSRTYEFDNEDSEVISKDIQVLNNNSKLNSKKRKAEKIRRIFHHRTAKMLFLCTVIYLLTWLPFWIDIFGLTNNLVFRYLFFIGNATNPIVYGIVNGQIRKEFQNLLSRCCIGKLFGVKSRSSFSV